MLPIEEEVDSWRAPTLIVTQPDNTTFLQLVAKVAAVKAPQFLYVIGSEAAHLLISSPLSNV